MVDETNEIKVHMQYYIYIFFETAHAVSYCLLNQNESTIFNAWYMKTSPKTRILSSFYKNNCLISVNKIQSV